MKLKDAKLRIIEDSRKQPTLEAELFSENYSAKASVPSGKSRGKHEAFVLEPKAALEKFEEIKPKIINKEFKSQEDFDKFFIDLGGNLTLALSLAWARLKAKTEKKELYDYIRAISPAYAKASAGKQLPHPIFNMINGGAHAKNNLSFQEFHAIPQVKDFAIAMSLGREFYRKLRQTLENKFGKENITLGDEAGFSAPFKNNEEAISTLADLIEKNNYPIKLGLDVAATQFYKDGYYLVDAEKYSADDLKELYVRLFGAYGLISIEDPFYEEAFEDFAELTQNLTQNGREIFVITDDLTTTNPERLKTAIEKKSGNAILIKPNQIGNLTETLKVVKMAYENEWRVIVSHRSGETIDDFIADLAVAVSAWGIKAGAPANPERLVKYNRIAEIQSLLNSNQIS